MGKKLKHIPENSIVIIIKFKNINQRAKLMKDVRNIRIKQKKRKIEII